jgi:hypothetical protein
MKTAFYFFVMLLIFCCCAVTFNRPQWSISGDEQLVKIWNDGEPWKTGSAISTASGVIQLFGMGENFDYKKVDQLYLYISGGVGTKTEKIVLEQVKEAPDLWVYKYKDIVQKLQVAEMDTTKGKCQGVLEVHYDNSAMVFFVAPSYLGFNNRKNKIEMVEK